VAIWQVTVGVQFPEPAAVEDTQPGGNAGGAETASKPSHKSLTKNGVGVGVEVGTVAVGVGEGVPVGVGVGGAGWTSNDPMSMRPLKTR
jgi:hypothetical protein